MCKAVGGAGGAGAPGSAASGAGGILYGGPPSTPPAQNITNEKQFILGKGHTTSEVEIICTNVIKRKIRYFVA